MPGSPTELGFGYFVIAKYAGYTAFCKWGVEPRLKETGETSFQVPMAAWKAGLLRTLLGVVIGVIVGIGFWKTPYFSDHGGGATLSFFVLLIPVRIGEWWALLRMAYGESAVSMSRRTNLIGGGILTSFCLDAVGLIAAFVLPGGAWVC